ncbi:hypothetical protein [Aquabacterium sp.]|uniref:hypothetical protein n=1 Tax=Aquabacterium sp. TaxID=1872578 RepID=UPI0037830C42
MREVIYVRGGPTYRPIAAEAAWCFAHPRGVRAPTLLTHFDYVLGLRRHWFNWTGTLPPTTAPGLSLPITGVEDLYDYIKTSGDTQPGSIGELHFFTHGYEGGPVLVNTEDRLGDPNSRDPNDLDPRIKDFGIDTVLGGANGQRFKRAFAGDALIKLWGCTHLEKYRGMVKHQYFGTRDAQKKKRIKAAYQAFIEQSTYQYALCKALGMRVYAAPLGWGTNPHLPKPNAPYADTWPPAARNRWWRVSPTFWQDHGADFYRRVLGADIDPVGYVGYTPSIVTASYVDISLDEVMLADYPDAYASDYPDQVV